ncbi:hypothetical protein EBR43_14325 [bacterium]|nr:hypothetical protein [bacterium]
MSEEKEYSLDDLISQLKVSASDSKKASSEQYNLPKDKLEEFVLNSTGKLVTQGLEIVEGVKDYVMNNPESREVLALSDALKAVASALTVVKDIHITQMKKETAKEIKTMEIESRKVLKSEDNKNKLMLSRDEVFKKILEDAKVIEAEAVTVSQFPKLSS